MIICKTRTELSALLKSWRDDGKTIGAAPTMGALHEGHLSLVDLVRGHSDRTIATIFVNPLQFGPHEDFDVYPRDLNGDAAKLKSRGCDAVFAPDARDLFAEDFSTNISVHDVGENHCAVARPHFFDGVATIVAKLLLLLRPDAAVFGEKDFQQLAVIRRMVRDLEIGVDILGAPIVREADGLAMSSRNQYLSKSDREIAPALFTTISEAATRILATGATWEAVGAWTTAKLRAAGFASVDYVNFVNAATLEMMNHAGPEGRILAAARLGETRLIDNCAVAAKN
ncbi:MAG: pantoate--beta-alanine ligase [Marinicaulis sp.]|nr:pantoate--beta-alanine ligase [Marinicaulis sp.]